MKSRAATRLARKQSLFEEVKTERCATLFTNTALEYRGSKNVNKICMKRLVPCIYRVPRTMDSRIEA